MSISFSQKVNKDGFVFIFPEKGYEGTPLAFEIKLDSTMIKQINDFNFLWHFGHSIERDKFISNDKEYSFRMYQDRSIGPKVEFTYPGQGANNGFKVKVDIIEKEKRLRPQNVMLTYEVFIPIYNVAPSIDIAIAPKEGLEGEELFFKATHTDPSAVDIHTYFWNFDGKKEIGPEKSLNNSNSITYIYPNDGLFNVSSIVKDDDGDADTAYHQILIKNIPPVLETIEHPLSGKEGERLSFKANYFDQGVNDNHQFVWNFGDGKIDTTLSNRTDHIYQDNGNYSLEVIVFDDANDSDTLKSSLSIQNVAPKITVSIPENGEEGIPVPLSLSIKDDGGNDTHIVSWDLGDGNLDTNLTFNHVYIDNGTYNINVNVEDDDGGTDTWTQNINIYNLPPEVEFNFPDSTKEGQTITFRCDATDKGKNDTFTYIWNFGDGKKDTLKSTQHRFNDNDNYKVMVTVKDNDGGITTKEKFIRVLNVPPTLSSSIPKKQYEGSKVEIFAELKNDPGTDDTHTYLFDYGDGKRSNQNFHIYQDNGDYEIKIILTDDDGGADTNKQIINIVNLPPKLFGDLLPESNEGDEVNFQIAVEDPGNLDTHIYKWNFGDGNFDSKLVTNHTYKDNGEYRVVLTVTDDDEGVDSLVHNIKVKNLPPKLSASFVSSSKVQIPEEEGTKGSSMDVISQTIDISKTEGEHSSPTGDKNTSVFFNASVTDAGMLDTHSFTWDFGDGSSSNEAEVEHVYTNNGIFPVKIIAMDDDKGSDTLTQTIAITNVTPAMGATLVSPDSSFQSVVIIPLDIEGAKEDNVFNWSFGDGGSSSYSMPTYIYKEKGDYRLAARITDINDKTGIYIKNINVNNKYPKLVQSIKDRNLIDSGESNQFFSSDLFVISSPKMRIYNPNTFPTIVFTIHNYTDKATDVNFNLLFPDGWEIIALTKPDVLRPNSTERIRATFQIPHDENADVLHKIRLIAKIGEYDHMVSIMTSVDAKVKEKPAFQLEAYKENEEVFINKRQDIIFNLKNTGNVSDSYDIDAFLPVGWELINVNSDFELAQNETQKIVARIRVPKKVHNQAGIDEEVFVRAISKKLDAQRGTWFNEVLARDGFCSDNVLATCSIIDRQDKEDCLASSQWIPEVKSKLEHCSDSLFTTKKGCLAEKDWLDSVPGVEAFCSDTLFTSIEDCNNNNGTWNAKVEAIPERCSDERLLNKKDCLADRKWIPTIRGVPAYCKGYPDRQTKLDCEQIGEWTEAFAGTLSEEECTAVNTWHPEVKSQEAYCSESYWPTKEDCESSSQWLLPKPAVEDRCEDPQYTSKDECNKNSTWIKGTPAVDAYCQDGISPNLVQCNSSGEWFPEVLSSKAYCSDSNLTNKAECEEVFSWTPSIEARDAYCSDLVTTNIKDCETPPGMEKTAQVTLYSRLKNSKGKSTSMFAWLPLQIGVELGNLSSDFVPSSRFLIESNRTQLGPYTTSLKYSQRYNQLQLSDSLETSELSQKYFEKYTIDRVQFYLSRGNWELTLGDDSIDKFGLITSMSPIPIFGMNGSETYRGGRYKYQYNNLVFGVSYGSGPSYSNEHKISSVSVNTNDEARSSHYGLYYQNKIDSATTHHFVDFQRLSNSNNLKTAQIFAFTNSDTLNDWSGQLIFDYNKNKLKITNRSFYFGDQFMDAVRGRVGTNFTINLKLNKNIYNFTRAQIYNQKLFDTTPEFTEESFEDCGLDNECMEEVDLFDEGEQNGQFDLDENFTDLNGNGVWDIDTSYIKSAIVMDLDEKLFFNFSNNLRLTTGVNYRQSNYSNGFSGNSSRFQIRILKNLKRDHPYIEANHINSLELNEEKLISTQIKIGNRRFFKNSNLNFEQSVSFINEEPADFSTTVDARFKLFNLDWSFYFLANNMYPFFTDDSEKGAINVLSLKNNFFFKLLGVLNRVQLGVGYSPATSQFNFTFGITPYGGSHASKIQLPVPLINIKGRYSGEIYVDENNNGVRDNNEKGVPNIMLFINGYLSVTNENGEYEFGAIETGTYKLRYDPNTLNAQYKFKESFPQDVTIEQGSRQFHSFGVTSVCKIKGLLFIDSDMDKIKDHNEQVISNAAITVQATNDEEQTFFTDQKGRYEVSDLKTGKYNLIVDPNWLPERTEITYSEESKKFFTKLGWPVDVSNDKQTAIFDIPIKEKEMEIKINVKNTNGR